MSPLRTALAAACCLTALAACGGTEQPTAPAAPAAPPSDAVGGHEGRAGPTAAATGSLDAADQTTDGLSVTVASVQLDAGGAGGWIALHKDSAGAPGPVTYVVGVPPGPSEDVTIRAPEGLETGAYWPMLHLDAGVPGTYEFPGADLPVTTDGQVVMEKIQLTVR
jgi:hypothetical protein